jgi:hypothetical protein
MNFSVRHQVDSVRARLLAHLTDSEILLEVNE